MTRIEEQLWRQEQSFLYSAGCQTESEFDLAYECDCGHSCEAGDEHKVNGETKCPDCWDSYISELQSRYEHALKKEFSEEEIEILFSEEILEKMSDGVLHRTVSV